MTFFTCELCEEEGEETVFHVFTRDDHKPFRHLINEHMDELNVDEEISDPVQFKEDNRGVARELFQEHYRRSV